MRKSVFIILIAFLFYQDLYGQISTMEDPISFKTTISAFKASERTQKILPSFDMKIVEQEDKEDEANGIPPRFGYSHKVNFNLENSGEWMVLPDGSKMWRLVISCPVRQRL